MLECQGLHMSSMQKADSYSGNGEPQDDIKQVISKPSSTVALCYLALDAFYTRDCLIDFCDLEWVLSLILRPVVLTFSDTRLKVAP